DPRINGADRGSARGDSEGPPRWRSQHGGKGDGEGAPNETVAHVWVSSQKRQHPLAQRTTRVCPPDKIPERLRYFLQVLADERLASVGARAQLCRVTASREARTACWMRAHWQYAPLQ